MILSTSYALLSSPTSYFITESNDGFVLLTIIAVVGYIAYQIGRSDASKKDEFRELENCEWDSDYKGMLEDLDE